MAKLTRFLAVVTNGADDCPSLGLLAVDAPDLPSAWDAVVKDRKALEGDPLVLDVDTPEKIIAFVRSAADGPANIVVGAKQASRTGKGQGGK